MWCSKTFALFFATQIISGLGQITITIGGIFDNALEIDDNTTLTDEQIFQAATKLSNDHLIGYGIVYKALTEESYEHRNGPFKATLSTCSLVSQEAMVIFGPKETEDINVVQSVCDYKDIAHVVTRWVHNPADHISIINFYPNSAELSLAYFDILQASGWKSFTVFYEDHESMLRLGPLINMAKNAQIIVTVKQLDEGDGAYRRTLKEAVHSGQTNYVIDCSIKILEEVLRQAQQVGLMTNQYNYFITNLDLHTIDLEPFRYSESNITGIRIFDPDDKLVQDRNKFLTEIYSNFDITKMKTETALLMDAVTVVTKVISTKLSFQEMEFDFADSGCYSLKSSRHGYTISNNVKTSKNIGMTGLIEFDGSGFRSNFNLEIIEIKEDSIAKVGAWNSSKGLTTVYGKYALPDEDPSSLRNKTFRVLTCLTDPYCMLKETSVQLFNNDRFEGFAIDLIQALAEIEGFNYTFLIREDKKNGERLDDGTWSGMIGDVMYGQADLAITDLTITAEREEAVDFTSPFMNLGISILAKKPGNAPPSFFSFADPFALDTWIMLALAYMVVSMSFFIMGRLCQDEWTNPYPCIEEPEFLINQFSLSNSAWFAAGALMQQGTEIAPIAISTRMVTGVWWFFVLIMVSLYTANLAAFLATENPIELFTDVDSLIKNREKYGIRMGAKAAGATQSFFKGKSNENYKKISDYMAKHPEDMVNDNKIGVKNAEDYTYAFFMESISIEYETQRHCELKQYGKLLDDKGYGIAMRKNSTYRKKLSTAILKLQSSGELDNLKRKWWEEKRGGGQCNAVEDVAGTPPLSVQNVIGVFYVSIGGTICAMFLVIAEFLLRTLKISKKMKVPFKEVFRLEMKAFMDFNSNVKPTIQQSSKSGSKSSQESGTSNNNLMPPAAAYGFIPSITKNEISH